MTRAETAYHGELGEYFATLATNNASNAHTDRPAMLKLAGDVDGLRALDVGCGAGHYAAELRDRGAAEVVGVEGSETLLRAARERLGDGVELHHHDLEEPLTFLEDASFDLVVMALVYHHVEAREQLLAELRRVLRPGGTLLVSTTHPAAEWTWFGGSYFADERVEAPIDGGFTISYRRMTLEKFLGELLGAGFVLEQLVEPRAMEEAREIDPRRYEKTHTVPYFLAVRLRRP
ncbi:class I SAM-dependent methyltransferase [Streptomyces sp. PSKA54]|uniref:Class I SAM-dependent methyltransferase n=1 Tax=Streptomyces himalayensis subsp. aureolus TaxID=2758039 RepID=A0A7W2CYP3_9ACTN|nr:class I SAM-dependent methyltransferase [Streptomyces himalayensis]MBA4861352.1 class I SAM-dependent methyltransferase [Streptomyces himalayensis subsp. aureolus]